MEDCLTLVLVRSRLSLIKYLKKGGDSKALKVRTTGISWHSGKDVQMGLLWSLEFRRSTGRHPCCFSILGRRRQWPPTLSLAINSVQSYVTLITPGSQIFLSSYLVLISLYVFIYLSFADILALTTLRHLKLQLERKD